MIGTQSKGREKQGGEMLLRASGLGAFAVALSLLSAAPLHADTFYSGAAVNSNGSVYSWGVTSACSMSSHTTHMNSTLTSPKGRQASGNASDGCSTRVDLYLAFDPTDLGTYEVESDSWAFCPVLGLWFWNGVESQGSANNNAQLSCGGAVTRPQSVTCTVSNYGGATISNWKFTDGQNGQVTVTSGSGANTWSGAAVQSGTVSVQVSYLPGPITASVTVNARTGWAFTAASPAQEPNGGGTGTCAGVLPTLTSPPVSGSNEGYSCLEEGSTYNSQTVSGGPNSGYTYITSATNTTVYQWEIVPDLTNTSSAFYKAQCGNWNAQTQTGFISGANLAAQTQRHEIGSVQGHWGEYDNAQNQAAYNVGLVYEAVVARPGVSISTALGNSPISSDQSYIHSQFNVDPYPINEDQNGTFLGNINFAPYASCH
jgi:hypothetical protein